MELNRVIFPFLDKEQLLLDLGEFLVDLTFHFLFSFKILLHMLYLFSESYVSLQQELPVEVDPLHELLTQVQYLRLHVPEQFSLNISILTPSYLLLLR